MRIHEKVLRNLNVKDFLNIYMDAEADYQIYDLVSAFGFPQHVKKKLTLLLLAKRISPWFKEICEGRINTPNVCQLECL
jgi:hypothetical protein